MNKYIVSYEYRAVVMIEIEAENEKEAEGKGLLEADEYINSKITLYDITVKDSQKRGER